MKRQPAGENTVVSLESSAKLPFSKSRTRKIGLLILRLLRLKNCKVYFQFVTGREMKLLNRKFKGRNRATDVLAFSQVEGHYFPEIGRKTLGDIVISVDAARRQAPLYGSSFKKELILYMIHGTLHLLGYDDEKPSKAKVMKAKENKLMREIEERFL